MPETTQTDKPDEGLATLQKQLAESTADNERLKIALKSKPAPPPANPAQPTKDEIEKTFWGNPIDMTSAIAQRAAQEAEQRVMNALLPSQRDAARDKVRSEDSEVFDKYESEILEMVNTTSPQFHGNINVWQNALAMIRGKHFDEISKAKADKKATTDEGQVTTPRLTSDGPAPPSSRQPPAPKVTPLTDDEKATANGLDMTEAEYKRGQYRLANQDTEWGKVITFSSVAKRRADADKRAKQQRAS